MSRNLTLSEPEAYQKMAYFFRYRGFSPAFGERWVQGPRCFLGAYCEISGADCGLAVRDIPILTEILDNGFGETRLALDGWNTLDAVAVCLLARDLATKEP